MDDNLRAGPGVRPKRAMGSHHSAHADSTSWLTPPHIFAALGEFDLDPCAAPGWITAKRHIILPEDGLTATWNGRVWLNPPYGMEAWTWLSRLAEHGEGIALVFARTETAGFVREVWEKASGVLFLHGRLYFHYPDGTRAGANSGAPSCLVSYGEHDADVLRTCGLNGTFVPLAAHSVPSDDPSSGTEALRRAEAIIAYRNHVWELGYTGEEPILLVIGFAAGLDYLASHSVSIH